MPHRRYLVTELGSFFDSRLKCNNSDALELSDENVDGAENIYNSKAVLVPAPRTKSNDDLKNTLKGTDELIEVVNPEGILTEIPDDFVDFVEDELSSESESQYSILESAFELESDAAEHESVEDIPNLSLGVTKIKWRITRTLKPKPPPPPPPRRITSSIMESIADYDPSLYEGENYESENERQEAFNETLETTISEEDEVFSDALSTSDSQAETDDNYTVDVDESILEEESVLHTKPYIKLRVDWMW